MRLLLDTHAFLWFIGGHPQLDPGARALIEDPGTERFLSVASLWEMAIKASVGKLKLALSFPEMLQRDVRGNGMRLCTIEPEHLDVVAALPFHHRDPFDRLIISQSLVEDLTILSTDRTFDRYPARRIW